MEKSLKIASKALRKAYQESISSQVYYNKALEKKERAEKKLEMLKEIYRSLKVSLGE